jgi:hypothetical protein
MQTSKRAPAVGMHRILIWPAMANLKSEYWIAGRIFNMATYTGYPK